MSRFVLKRKRSKRSPVIRATASAATTLFDTLKKVPSLSPSWQACIPLAVLLVLVGSTAAFAQQSPSLEEVAKAAEGLRVGLDTMWVVIAGMLVFFMNARLLYAGNRILSPKKRCQRAVEEPDRVRPIHHCLLGDRFQLDVQ